MKKYKVTFDGIKGTCVYVANALNIAGLQAKIEMLQLNFVDETKHIVSIEEIE